MDLELQVLTNSTKRVLGPNLDPLQERQVRSHTRVLRLEEHSVLAPQHMHSQASLSCT